MPTEAPRRRGRRRRRRRGIALPSFNLGARWGWLANTTSWPLNSRVKPRYQSVLSKGSVTANVTIFLSFLYSMLPVRVNVISTTNFFFALIKICDNLKQRNGHKIWDNFHSSCEILGFRHEEDKNCGTRRRQLVR